MAAAQGLRASTHKPSPRYNVISRDVSDRLLRFPVAEWRIAPENGDFVLKNVHFIITIQLHGSGLLDIPRVPAGGAGERYL